MDFFTRNHSHSHKGFTLIELIVAIGILLFGVVLVYSAFSSVAISTNTISSRFIASYLAQEGLEIVINMRDTNVINNAWWATGLIGSPCSTGCQADYKTQSASQLSSYSSSSFLKLNSDGFYSYDASGTPTTFTRKITISIPPASFPPQVDCTTTCDYYKVDVEVFWNSNNQSFTYKTSEYMYNWQ